MLKVAAAVMVFLLWTTRGSAAETFLTGSIRDTRGVPVAGARVSAFDGVGKAVGSDVAKEDGTFALSAVAQPTSILIACDYCQPARRTVVAGEPTVVIIDRYVAVTAGSPTPDDVRALPYRQSSDLASLVPFSNIGGSRIADRGLDRFGAIVVDGLPFVDERDGSSVDAVLPAHSVATLGVVSPSFAPIVGGYATGGVYAFDLSDPDLSTSRIDGGNAADIVARTQSATLGAGYSTSSDDGEPRQSADVNARFGLGSGQLSAEALDLGDATTHAAGFGLAYTSDVDGYATGTTLSATQIGGASLVALAAHVAAHDPLHLELGIRATRATADDGTSAATQADGALYLASSGGTTANHYTASFGWDTGSDTGVAAGSRATALIGSLADDVRLGSQWTMHAGLASDLRIPTFEELAPRSSSTQLGDRSRLLEDWLSYTDLRRLRIRAIAYTERTTGPGAQTIGGVGVEAGWQIAPTLALRTWILGAQQQSPSLVGAQTLSGNLAWFTYDKWFRIDALVRRGALDGDLRIPVARSYAISVGTARSDRRRFTTIGLTQR